MNLETLESISRKAPSLDPNAIVSCSTLQAPYFESKSGERFRAYGKDLLMLASSRMVASILIVGEKEFRRKDLKVLANSDFLDQRSTFLFPSQFGRRSRRISFFHSRTVLPSKPDSISA